MLLEKVLNLITDLVQTKLIGTENSHSPFWLDEMSKEYNFSFSQVRQEALKNQLGVGDLSQY